MFDIITKKIVDKDIKVLKALHKAKPEDLNLTLLTVQQIPATANIADIAVNFPAAKSITVTVLKHYTNECAVGSKVATVAFNEEEEAKAAFLAGDKMTVKLSPLNVTFGEKGNLPLD